MIDIYGYYLLLQTAGNLKNCIMFNIQFSSIIYIYIRCIFNSLTIFKYPEDISILIGYMNDC